jgi:APA family basic amino acid/polyamine antiporter
VKNWNARKTVTAHEDMPAEHRLRKTLSWPHLVALGVGAIVGTGILTLIGVGADKAGPSVILSFAIAGIICAFAALAYAEMATMIPASGSAYTYTYVVIGELVAWIVGWSLILEYSLVVSAVAVGWSGYAAPLLQSALGVPMSLMQGPELGGIVNLPAIFIIAVVAALLIFGTKESATLNAVLVLVKIAALIVFVAVTLPYFNAANFEPFMPFGFGKTVGPDEVERRDGGGGDHLLRLLRLRRDRDRRRGSQEPGPRSFDRHRRIDGRLRRSSTWPSPPPQSARSATPGSPTARSRWR